MELAALLAEYANYPADYPLSVTLGDVRTLAAYCRAAADAESRAIESLRQAESAYRRAATAERRAANLFRRVHTGPEARP